MDWIRGFQKSIDYIDEHITESLEYEHIAQQMNCLLYTSPSPRDR